MSALGNKGSGHREGHSPFLGKDLAKPPAEEVCLAEVKTKQIVTMLIINHIKHSNPCFVSLLTICSHECLPKIRRLFTAFSMPSVQYLIGVAFPCANEIVAPLIIAPNVCLCFEHAPIDLPPFGSEKLETLDELEATSWLYTSTNRAAISQSMAGLLISFSIFRRVAF